MLPAKEHTVSLGRGASSTDCGGVAAFARAALPAPLDLAPPRALYCLDVSTLLLDASSERT